MCQSTGVCCDMLKPRTVNASEEHEARSALDLQPGASRLTHLPAVRPVGRRLVRLSVRQIVQSHAGN